MFGCQNVAYTKLCYDNGNITKSNGCLSNRT